VYFCERVTQQDSNFVYIVFFPPHNMMIAAK